MSRPLGFMGIGRNKIEMLFISPDALKGIRQDACSVCDRTMFCFDRFTLR